jgi:hypothetical protein
MLEQDANAFVLGSLLGAISVGLLGVFGELFERLEKTNLLALTTSVHQINQVDLDVGEFLHSITSASHPIQTLPCLGTESRTYLFALVDGYGDVSDPNFCAQHLELLERAGETLSGNKVGELVFVAGGAETVAHLLVASPALLSGETIKLLLDGSSGVRLEVREELKERHYLRSSLSICQ